MKKLLNHWFSKHNPINTSINGVNSWSMYHIYHLTSTYIPISLRTHETPHKGGILVKIAKLDSVGLQLQSPFFLVSHGGLPTTCLEDPAVVWGPGWPPGVPSQRVQPPAPELLGNPGTLRRPAAGLAGLAGLAGPAGPAGPGPSRGPKRHGGAQTWCVNLGLCPPHEYNILCIYIYSLYISDTIQLNQWNKYKPTESTYYIITNWILYLYLPSAQQLYTVLEFIAPTSLQ